MTPFLPRARRATGTRPRPTNARPAFSLVEVTLAMGIASFACVTLLGLLSTGLTTFSSARQATIQAQVIENVFASTKVQDYNAQTIAATAATPTSRYFDNEGAELDKGAPGIIYTANIAYAPVSLHSPGGDSQTVDYTYGCRLNVSVSAVGDPNHPSRFTIVWPNYGAAGASAAN